MLCVPFWYETDDNLLKGITHIPKMAHSPREDCPQGPLHAAGEGLQECVGVSSVRAGETAWPMPQPAKHSKEAAACINLRTGIIVFTTNC